MNPSGTFVSKTPILSSNWTVGGYTYFFNAEPGEYIIVAMKYEVEQQAQQTSSTTSGNVTVTTFSGGGKTIFTDLTKQESAEKIQNKSRCRRTRVYWIFSIDANKEFGSADENQKHYASILRPGMLEKTGVLGSFFYNGTFRNDSYLF